MCEALPNTGGAGGGGGGGGSRTAAKRKPCGWELLRLDSKRLPVVYLSLGLGRENQDGMAGAGEPRVGKGAWQGDG